MEGNVDQLYCTCGHFLQAGTEEDKQFDSIPNYYIKKGRLHGHRYGKKPGDHEYFIANSLQEEMQEETFLG